MIETHHLSTARYWLRFFCLTLALAACSGATTVEPAAEAAPATAAETVAETEAEATPETAVETVAETEAEATPETAVEATVEATAEETDVQAGADELAMGDPVLGEALFNDKNRIRCAGCHTLDGGTHRPGPTLLGISQVAGERVDGLSAAEYVRLSIVDPEAYLVEGYEESEKPMPVFTLVEPDAEGPMRLGTVTEEELNNLIAFVLTH